MNTFLQHLSEPEYMHVLLNPVPVYGLAIGVIGLLLAVLARNRTAIVITLALVFLGGLSAWPVYQYGEAAYDRVKSMSDQPGEQWLDEHMARAEKLISAFYLLAALAAVAALAPIKWPRTSMPLATATVVLGLATLAIGGWISYAGGHVRHKEFRFEPPPVAKEEHHHDGDEHGARTHDGNEPAQPMDHGASQPSAAPPAQEQLEASRLQLEASRLQLEASRKQLEAADAAKAKTASPSPQHTQSPHAEDGDEHEHKP